jgi:cobaltochelatase CobS
MSEEAKAAVAATAPTGVAKVEDLVKKALKEALDKRKLAKEDGIAPTEYMEVMKTVTKEIESTTPTAVLKEGQKWFSDVIGNKLLPAEQDFCVTTFHGYDWHESIVDFIPEANNDYIIDLELSKSILRAWELDEKVLCYGPTGAGKSSLIEELCARTYRPFVRINCTGDMDSSMIFGQLTAKDGSTVWVDGAVTEAVRHGAVFAWDEWDVTPPEISMGLQWLLEDNGKLFLKEMPGATKDKQITPHEHFRLVAIGNTQGQGDDTGAHAGTNVQNSASLDRFGTTVYVDYLAASIEVSMLLKKYKGKIATKMATELVKLANLVRQGYKTGQLSLTVSPRALFNICKKVSVGCTLQEAFSLSYLNKLNDTQHKVAKELYIKVFGKN